MSHYWWNFNKHWKDSKLFSVLSCSYFQILSIWQPLSVISLFFKTIILFCLGGAQLGVWISWPGAWKSQPRRRCQPSGKTGENALFHCWMGRGKNRCFDMCTAFYQMFQINWHIEGLTRPFTVTLHAFQSEETGKDHSSINNLKAETERDMF